MALMVEKSFDAAKIQTPAFPLADLASALRYACEHVEDAISVLVNKRRTNAIAD